MASCTADLLRRVSVLFPLNCVVRALTTFAFLLSVGAQSFAVTPPNIVLILADDLGWADLGCYGNTFNETPNIDRLAKEGIRFSQFYAGPVCSPTRANLQSGQDQARFGITQHIPGHRRPYAKLRDPVVASHLPLEVETFAERLSSAGYATGYFGKWHLGDTDFGPDKQGWQESLVCQGNTVQPNAKEVPGSQRTAQFLTDEAIRFIEQHKSDPFLIQVSHSAVHIPLSTTTDLLQKYRSKPAMEGYPSRPEYAGLLEELDRSVGQIVAAVDRFHLAKQTLVILLSDNGGLEHDQSGRVVTSNKPMRGEKGTLYEGGIRVPAIFRWKGQISANSRCETPATTMDLYPTFVELAGASSPQNQPLDGVSLKPLLAGSSAALARDTLYWHLPHYHHSTPASAIRSGDWKLIEFFETGEAELHNLRQDSGELMNLAERDPQRVEQLRSQLVAWREKVGARMPEPNPDYDPARATELGGKKGSAGKRGRPRTDGSD